MPLITRETLYAEVWAEPTTTVAKRYGVSSNYLARICARLGVPCPPRGFWAKRAAGIRFKRPALPDPLPGSDLEWVRDGAEPRRHPMTAATLPKKRPKAERPGTHPLLIQARQDFEHAREDRDGRYIRPWKRTVADIFVSKEALTAALQAANAVFLALENHGAQVMFAPPSAHYRDVEPEVRAGQKRTAHDCSYEFSVGRWRPGRQTVALFTTVTLGLTLFEISEEVEAEYDSKGQKYVRVDPELVALRNRIGKQHGGYSTWVSKRWMGSGRLGLQAYVLDRDVDWQRQWHEPKTGWFSAQAGTLAKEINEAALEAARIIQAAVEKREEERRAREAKLEEQRRQDEARMAELRRQDEENRPRLEAQRRKEALDKARKEFVASVVEWRRAQEIRQYVWETHALIADSDVEIVEDSVLADVLRWAVTYADEIDPHTTLRGDIAEAKSRHAEDCERCQAAGRARDAEEAEDETVEGTGGAEGGAIEGGVVRGTGFM